MATDAMSGLLENFDEEIEALTIAVTGGGAKDYAEYKWMCGRINAFRRSREIVKTMEQLLQYQDE